MDHFEYVVVDIETTGLSKHRHKITEIAAVKVRNGKIVDQFQTLVNPGVPIPSFITHLTGIDDDMVASASPINTILPSFFDFVGDCVLVAHNASFDYGFLSYNAHEHLDFDFDNEYLCTRRLANRLVPDLPSKKLSCLCEHFNIVNERAHRALADVHATAELFSQFLSMLDKLGVKEKEDVLGFQKKSLRQIYGF